jgi:uncharacterized protein YkwD
MASLVHARLPGAAVTVFLGVLCSTSIAGEAQAACANADALPGHVSSRALGKATHCLVNRARTRHGLPRVRGNRRLSLAARRHGRDMVRRRYFAHRSLSGESVTQRIRSTGYARSARRWRAGENIAWGDGRQATPRRIVRGWMRSPSHRHNILARRFRELGVAAVPGAPVRRRSRRIAATYVHEFGRVTR